MSSIERHMIINTQGECERDSHDDSVDTNRLEAA